MLEVDTRQDVRNALNRNIGSLITTQDFSKPILAANYLRALNEKGFVERESVGKYKILKKVILKKRGRQKRAKFNCRMKDLSTIPYILNSSDEGLTVEQIQFHYRRITPLDMQVNKQYLYKLLRFSVGKGVAAENGKNFALRKSPKGSAPKRLILLKKDITDKEWAILVDEYRAEYQFKKENKVTRRSKPKTVMSKVRCCDSIAKNFDEFRNNPNKKYIEEFFINKVKKRLGGKLVKCLAITGPDYHHHMHSLFTTIANRVMVCEIAQDIFDIIYRKSLICPYSLDNKVTVHRCDVDELSPINCRYADIDLMRTIKNNYDIVSGQLKKQDDFCSKDEEKYFTFTFTRRSQGGDIFGRTLLYLEKLVKEHFGMELIGLSDGTDVCEQHGKFKSCKQHFLLAKKYGRVNKMYVFTYQDDVPMMNVLIAYK